MKKCLPILLLLLLVCTVALTACVKDKDRTQFVYDRMQLFDEAQVAKLNETAKQVQSQYGVDVFVGTCQRNGTKAQYVGDDFRQLYNIEGDAIILVVNAQGVGNDYHFDIYTYGLAYLRVKDAEIETLLYSAGGDAILTSDSAYAAGGLADMITMCGRAYKGRIAGLSMGVCVVIIILIALVAALVVTLRVRRQYTRKRKNETYPLDKYCQLKLKDRSDTYVRSVTTFVIINNGSGGGGGHSSGGGGGGGHRGGR